MSFTSCYKTNWNGMRQNPEGEGRGGTREMQFPDRYVTFPCSVRPKNWIRAVGLGLFSAIENFACRFVRQNSQMSPYFPLLVGN